MTISMAILAADRAAAISDMPVNVIVGADTVSCRKSVLSETDRAAAAGELEDYVFSLHSVTGDWTTLPVLGDLATVDAVEYRILRIVTDPVGTRLDCGAKYSDRTSAR